MYTVQRNSGRGPRALWLIILAVIVLAGAYAYWATHRPLPRLKPADSSVSIKINTPAARLSWPAAGQAAVGIPDSSIVQSHGAQKPVPTASTAKLITVLAVLRQKPLKPGQQGPIITLGPKDVALYNAYRASAGSVVPVTAGEKISEYQMLQAIMLPSANNIADSLAIWAFGSLPAYANFANNYVKQLGLSQTRVGSDASGLAPTTVSTARDLMKLGQAAMQNPVLAQIVNQPTANLPVANTVKNVNFLLGTSGIIGVKTGNSDEAGGVFVSASRIQVNGQSVTIVTAVAGSDSLWHAMHDSLILIKSAQANFQKITAVKSGQPVGTYELPWGGNVRAVAAQDLNTQAWNGSPVAATANLNSIAPDSSAGQTVGSVNVSGTNQKVDLKLKASPTKPSTWWRLTHPL